MAFTKRTLLWEGAVVMVTSTISKYSRLMSGMYFPTGVLSLPQLSNLTPAITDVLIEGPIN